MVGIKKENKIDYEDFPEGPLDFWENYQGQIMGIINIVKNVKEIHKEFVVLVRVGNFYNCYGRDSYIISYLLGYKINIIDNNIYNSSFPKSAYNKVLSILEKNKINYIVLDKRNNYDVEEEDNNKNLNNYQKFYEKAKKEIAKKMRIEKIYKYLLLCNDENTIYEVEKTINERRKI